jgi:hypothetical protein
MEKEVTMRSQSHILLWGKMGMGLVKVKLPKQINVGLARWLSVRDMVVCEVLVLVGWKGVG